MTERERWIVYPLVLFALGAALRDKFSQSVTTKELTAQHIICDDLVVRDPSTADRIVAKLTSDAPPNSAPGTPRFGVLALFDSQGKELCGVTNDMLQVRHVSAQEINGQVISVVDPQNPQRRLALLTSTSAKHPDGKTRRLGSLLLTDDAGQSLFGLANDQMQMRSISCQGVAIIDPENPTHVLAALGSALVKEGNQQTPARTGILQLNDQRFIGLRGNPTEAPFESPPPPTEPTATEAPTDGAEAAGESPADAEAAPADDKPAAEAPAAEPSETAGDAANDA
jgi:hypothetical protein